MARLEKNVEEVVRALAKNRHVRTLMREILGLSEGAISSETLIKTAQKGPSHPDVAPHLAAAYRATYEAYGRNIPMMISDLGLDRSKTYRQLKDIAGIDTSKSAKKKS